MSEPALAYVLAAIATLCWGVVVVFIKLARTPGRLGIGISLATGASVMLACAGRDLARVGDLTVPQLGLFLLTGTLQLTMGCTLYYESIQRGSLSVVVPITRVKAVLIFFLSIALGLETFRWVLLASASFVVLGGLFVSAPDPAAGYSERKTHWDSIAMAVAACLCWTFGETLIGKLPKSLPPVTANALLLCSGLLSYCVYVAACGAWRDFAQVSRRGLWCYMAHGVISLSLAYLLFIRAVQIAGPPRIAVVTSLYPLVSALIGWSLFKERFSPLIGVGAVLLVAGVVLLRLV